jgi:hypothetical protein
MTVMEVNRRMALRSIILWLKRATGIGYKHPKPIEHETHGPEQAAELKHKTDKLVRDMERLEQELRRVGY